MRLEEDIAIVGITDYAQEQLGDIVYVQLPDVGDTVQAGSVIGELESTKSVSDVFSPINGEIVARNEALDDGPEVINGDAYGEGWLVKIRPSDDDPTEQLISAEAYAGLTDA